MIYKQHVTLYTKSASCGPQKSSTGPYPGRGPLVEQVCSKDSWWSTDRCRPQIYLKMFTLNGRHNKTTAEMFISNIQIFHFKHFIIYVPPDAKTQNKHITNIILFKKEEHFKNVGGETDVSQWSCDICTAGRSADILTCSFRVKLHKPAVTDGPSCICRETNSSFTLISVYSCDMKSVLHQAAAPPAGGDGSLQADTPKDRQQQVLLQECPWTPHAAFVSCSCLGSFLRSFTAFLFLFLLRKFSSLPLLFSSWYFSASCSFFLSAAGEQRRVWN